MLIRRHQITAVVIGYLGQFLAENLLVARHIRQVRDLGLTLLVDESGHIELFTELVFDKSDFVPCPSSISTATMGIEKGWVLELAPIFESFKCPLKQMVKFGFTTITFILGP